MKILFDQGTPVPLRQLISGHSIETVYERGWQELTNGQLLEAAEHENFEVLVTTDQNLRYQQNLQSRKIAVVVLLSTSWPRIRNNFEAIRKAIASTTPGSYCEIPIE